MTLEPLISGLFNEFKKAHELSSMKESDAFELFAANVVLRDELISQVEMTELLLDAGTIGIDVALLEINGELAFDCEDVDRICDGKSELSVNLTMMQIKSSTSMDSKELLNFGDAAQKALSNQVSDQYPKLQQLSRGLFRIFDQYASRLKGRPRVNLAYISTANDIAIADHHVTERAETITKNIRSLSYIDDAAVELFGASRLYESHRRKQQANEMEIVLEKAVNLPKMPGVAQAILGVVSVRELLKLITNSDGSLNETVFYDNVRGFKGTENSVNRQIMGTLDSDTRALLPVLNNGVTVVATSYSPKPGDAISITGYQVVNGCQTSHCIFLQAQNIGDATDSVFVPIRLVVTEDEAVATNIIRATNSQTAVTDSDLIALTNFQRKLEEFYVQDQYGVGLSYERRGGQFYNREVTRTRVVTISEQIRAVAAMFLDLPHIAARYPKRLFEEVQDPVFDDIHRLSPYIASAFAAYRLEAAFKYNLESEYKPIRYHILMALKYELLGKDAQTPLQSKSIDDLSAKMIETLRRNDYVTTFRKVAEKIVKIADGDIPSSDRLKRQPFTTAIIRDMWSPGPN